MGKLTRADLVEKMAKLDFTMFATRSAGGDATARPMSNNGEVDDRGDSYFFSYADSGKVRDIRDDPRVVLTYTGATGMLGGPPLFVALAGEAVLIDDKAQFEAHWTKDLDRYFPDGINTPGIVMIRVRAARMRYWDGDDDGEITV